MQAKRNGYIDIIKFLFAIIIAEFHLGTGVFPGGRLAVEGFFMISGFLMMKSIEKSDESEGVGKSTVKFLFNKYKGLFFPLLFSALISYFVYSYTLDYNFGEMLKKGMLLFFEIIPLNTAGFKGTYVVGISWYLSSMFIALAILYPLTKKFKTGFTLVACPLIAALGYGILSAKYGDLAVGTSYIENTLLQTGIIRALAGCALGCLIYVINKKLQEKEFTVFAKTVFTVLELLGFALAFYLMHYLPKSRYDYLLVFVIFGLLIIGISGISYTSYLWNPKWTRFFGTASTLIVLNHYSFCVLLKYKLSHLEQYQKILIYIGLTAASCIVVYLLSILLKRLFELLFQKKLWVKENNQK